MNGVNHTFFVSSFLMQSISQSLCTFVFSRLGTNAFAALRVGHPSCSALFDFCIPYRQQLLIFLLISRPPLPHVWHVQPTTQRRLRKGHGKDGGRAEGRAKGVPGKPGPGTRVVECQTWLVSRRVGVGLVSHRIAGCAEGVGWSQKTRGAWLPLFAQREFK